MTARREFVKALAIAGLGTVLAPRTELFAAPFIRKRPRVLILGAGLAGISAAYTLHKAGVPSVILEARSRFGGRVFTHTMSRSGTRVELGAEWIGNSHPVMLQLCNEMELPLIDNTFKCDLLLRDKWTQTTSGSIFSPEWQEKLETMLREFAARSNEKAYTRELDSFDWYTMLRDSGCPDEDLWKHELGDSTDFGEGLRHTSALAAMSEYAENYGEIPTSNQMDKKIEGGNTGLAEALLKRMENSCRLERNKTVAAVSLSGKEYTVYCSDDSRYTATHIVCALPAPAVRKITWTPALSSEKMQALRSLQYARIQKHAFAFGEKFWSEDFSALSDRDSHYIYHATKFQNSASGALISYATGDKADLLHYQSAAFRTQNFLDTIGPAFGDKRGQLQEEARYYWGRDPYSGGAYAQFHPGQWSGIRDALRAPEKRIFFAGEHLAEWQGFMEGAVETGELAARAILG